MGNLFYKAWAFLRRDFLVDTSYRLNFAMNLVNMLFRVSVFYFLAVFIGKSPAISFLSSGNYFSYVLVGIAVSDYFSVVLNAFSNALREAQQEGTLEAVAASCTPLPVSLVCAGIYPVLYAFFQVGFYYILGRGLFGLALDRANYPAALLVFLLASLAFACLGFLSSVFVLVYKRGNPVNWVINSLSWLLSGILYPVSVLPDWLQLAAVFLPLTHALQAVRNTLLLGASLRDSAFNILALVLFFLAALAASVVSYQRAIKKVKEEGGLAHY